MKQFRYLALAALVAFAACDEETPVDPATQVGTVQVTVTSEGAGVSGVQVALAGVTSQSATTNATGQATFSDVAIGNYAVTISGLSADYACATTSQAVTVAGGQTATVSFSCTIVRTGSISGSVQRQDGTPVGGAGVTITRTAPAPAGTPQTLQTSANGQYSFTGLRSGTYTVSLASTANCTDAVTTQNATLVSGQAQVVNFTCTLAAPLEPATVAIQSITRTNLLGNQVPVASSSVNGIVNVTMAINEHDQRVTHLELLLGDEVVYTQTFAATAPEDMELAEFTVTATVNTAEFNQTTGAPRFLNQNTQFTARIRVEEEPGLVITASHAVSLTNQDITYISVLPERFVLSGSGTAFGAGLTWGTGDVTISALPVMYSGIGVSTLTVRLGAFSPLDIDNIGGTGGLTRADYISTAPYESDAVTRTLTSAPFTTTLLASNSITASSNGNRGVGDIEDVGVGFGGALNLSIVSTRADGQPGPTTANITALCTDGRVAVVSQYPPSGCADGQAANPLRLDNFAPLIDQLDQAHRWASSYTAIVGLASNGVNGSRWVHDGHEFEFTTSSNNSTTPRATDRGTGISGDYFSFEAGTEMSAMSEVSSGADLAESFDNMEYYLNATVMDIAGNERTMWDAGFSQGVTGSGSGSNSATLAAQFGVDHRDPCFTDDGLACANAMIGELTESGEVIGTFGAPAVLRTTTGTLVPGGGVLDGTSIITQLLDLENAANSTPGFPPGPVITLIRREFPGLSQTQRCLVGVISSNSCVAAGSAGSLSGIDGAFDFFGGAFSQYHATTGAIATTTLFGGSGAAGTIDLSARADNGVGFYFVQMTPVDLAGNEGPTLTRRFVRDVVPPFAGGVFFPFQVAPGAQATWQTTSQDDLALDRADFYLAFNGAAHAFRQAAQNIGSFPTGGFGSGQPYAGSSPTNVSVSATYLSGLQVGAGGAVVPASGGSFRIFDFGRNVVEAMSAGVPTVTPAAVPGAALPGAALSANANVLCWGTGCGNPVSTTLRFEIFGLGQGSTNPFSRVEFMVGVDANNDGAVDVDGAGNRLWTSIGTGTVSVVDPIGAHTWVWTRAVTASQLGDASSRQQAALGVGGPVHIRVLGYRSGQDGRGFTVADGAALCPAFGAGADAACTITLLPN